MQTLSHERCAEICMLFLYSHSSWEDMLIWKVLLKELLIQGSYVWTGFNYQFYDR